MPTTPWRRRRDRKSVQAVRSAAHPCDPADPGRPRGPEGSDRGQASSGRGLSARKPWGSVDQPRVCLFQDGIADSHRSMVPGRKASTTTSVLLISRRKISPPRVSKFQGQPLLVSVADMKKTPRPVHQRFETAEKIRRTRAFDLDTSRRVGQHLGAHRSGHPGDRSRTRIPSRGRSMIKSIAGTYILEHFFTNPFCLSISFLMTKGKRAMQRGNPFPFDAR